MKICVTCIALLITVVSAVPFKEEVRVSDYLQGRTL